MRWGIAAIAALTAACTTTSGVTNEGLVRLEQPADGEAIFVKDDEGRRLRIDPNTSIRFKRIDGTLTPWVRARHLKSNAQGVFRVHEMTLEGAVRAQVHGLHPRLTALLVSVLPPDAQYRTDEHSDGTVLDVTAPAGSIFAWVGTYLGRRAQSEAFTEGEAWWARGEGRWRFGYDFGGWSGPVDGHALNDVVDDGLEVAIGLAFDDIRGAEVRNLSGSKSLALVVGSAAIVAAIIGMAKGDVSFAGDVAVVSAEVAVRAAHFAAYCASGCGRRRTALPRGALISGNLRSVDGMAARPLFEATARRRSDVKLVVGGAIGYDFSLDRGLSEAVTVTAQIRDFFEVGGGAQHTGRRDADVGRYLLFGRVGGIFHLDEGHRIAAVLRGDLGAGPGAVMVRFDAGLRVEVVEGVGVGIYPYNPTFTTFEIARAETRARWSFPSTLELTWAF